MLTAAYLIGVGLVRRHVQRRLGRARPRVSAREAQHGARHLRRRRIVRPVRDGAVHAVAAHAISAGTARCSCSPRHRAPHGAARRARWSRSGPIARRVPAVGAARRCARRSATAATCCSRSASSSAASRSSSSAFICRAYLADRGMPAACRGDRAGTDRPVQHRRHLRWPAGSAAEVSKKYILSSIYFARAVVFAVFFWLPADGGERLRIRRRAGPPVAVDGAPHQRARRADLRRPLPRDAVRLQFFSHQIGSFLGAWLGGKLYDTTGSYDVVWYLSIALGIVAGLHQPADRRARDQATRTAAPAVETSCITARSPQAALPCPRRPARSTRASHRVGTSRSPIHV